MDINEEITTLQTFHDLKFDDNLYVALTLTLIASRHLVVSTEDITLTLNELVLIMDVIWGIPATVISFDCDYDYTEEEVLQLFMSDNDKLSPVYLLLGIEGLSTSLQNVILNIIRKKSITLNCEVQESQDLFSLIYITTDYSKLDPFLKNEFWFKQEHLISSAHEIHLPVSRIQPLLPSKLQQYRDLKFEIPKITILPELKRYIYDLIVFFRNHRVTEGGLPTRSIQDLTMLSQTLCIIFNKKFVVPTMVKLAVRKFMPYHLKIIHRADMEPSLNWGGDIVMAEELLKRITPEIVVEHVLGQVSPPI